MKTSWWPSSSGFGLADHDVGNPEAQFQPFVDLQLSVPRDDEHGRLNVAFLKLNAAAARNERFAEALHSLPAWLQTTVAEILRDGSRPAPFAKSNRGRQPDISTMQCSVPSLKP